MADDLDAILADMDRLSVGIDLAGELGRTLIGIAADSVRECAAGQVDPDGHPWDELSDDPPGKGYRSRKEKERPGKPKGRYDDVMLSDSAVSGEPTLSRRQAVYTFGEPGASRREAEYFQGPANPNQPPRVFVGLTARAIEKADRACDDFVDRLLGQQE